MTIEKVHDCSFELSKCNKMCSEMYYMNASLWREYYSLQQHYTHLQCELKLLLSLIERKKNSSRLLIVVNSIDDDNQSTYQLLLQIITELLNEKESQSNVLYYLIIMIIRMYYFYNKLVYNYKHQTIHQWISLCLLQILLFLQLLQLVICISNYQ